MPLYLSLLIIAALIVAAVFCAPRSPPDACVICRASPKDPNSSGGLFCKACD